MDNKTDPLGRVRTALRKVHQDRAKGIRPSSADKVGGRREVENQIIPFTAPSGTLDEVLGPMWRGTPVPFKRRAATG